MNFPTSYRAAIFTAHALVLSLAGCSFTTPFPSKTPAGAPKPPVSSPPITVAAPPALLRIEIYKASRSLQLWRGAQLLQSVGIALGQQPIGHKTCEGDSRTPEGVYTVTERKADSRFHLALRLSYPNTDDRLRAARLGCNPGGDIMIHGLPNGRGYMGSAHRQEDWTEGCAAVTNEEMDRLWALVPAGTRVEIRP